MKAYDIRNTQNYGSALPIHDSIPQQHLSDIADWLREIAAQLAELNKKLSEELK